MVTRGDGPCVPEDRRDQPVQGNTENAGERGQREESGGSHLITRTWDWHVNSAIQTQSKTFGRFPHHPDKDCCSLWIVIMPKALTLSFPATR